MTRRSGRLFGAWRIEDWLVGLTVVTLPWAFGGVEAWAYRPAAFLLVLGGCALVARHVRPIGDPAPRTGDWRWLVPAALLALWAGLQLVPLPGPVLESLSPRAYEIRVANLPGYPASRPADLLEALGERADAEVQDAASEPLPAGPELPAMQTVKPPPRYRWQPLSLQPSSTRERLFWFLALLVAFVVVRQRVADREVYRGYRALLFGLFGCMAAFGLVQAATWNGAIYWLRPPPTVEAQPFGPYINPNHFAGLMELGVPWLAGFGWWRLSRGGSLSRRMAGMGALVVAGLGLAAGIGTSSRMGALLLAGSLGALAVLGVRTLRARIAVGAAGLAVLGLGAWALAQTELAERFRFLQQSAQTIGYLGMRWVGWKATWSQFWDFPLTGAGFGSFRELIPHYLPAGEARRWSQAHNDYLEVLADGGIVAGILVLLLALGFWRRAVANLRRRTGSGISLSRLGLLLGLIALSLHALTEFNHQMPANALVFVVMGALATRPARAAEARGGSEANA